MNYFLVGDLHFSDRPRDSYRFGIFKWVHDQQKKYNPEATFILGDLCDQKDKHPATLVNRITNELSKLRRPIFILKGNHDYVDPTNPFFGFLNFVEGINFASNPEIVCKETVPVALLPHCRDEKQFVANCRAFSEARPRPALLLVHQTFEGAIAETGARLTGFRQSPIDYLRPRLGTYAGDVHRPQRAANVIYVGAPYQIRFGDDFEPRCILIGSDGNPKNLYFDTVRKWMLTISTPDEIIDNKNLLPGDQVKITVELPREEAVEWQAHRQKVREAAKLKGLEIFGLDCTVDASVSRRVALSNSARTHEAILTEFCKAENVPSAVREAGACLLLSQ